MELHGVRLAPVSEFALSPERPLVVHVHDLRPGERGGDMHLAYELGVVLAGRVRRDTPRGRFTLIPGQGWVCDVLEPHRWQAGPRGGRVLVFGFLPNLLEGGPALADFNVPGLVWALARVGRIAPASRRRRRLGALAREVAAEMAGARPEAAGPVYVAFLRLLTALADAGAQPRRLTVAAGGYANAAGRVRPALELAQGLLHRRVAVPEAARACALARSTFERLFKASTGLGFAEYSLRCRLARAAQALRATHQPIKAIAEAFGFNSASHFHRAFVAHYQSTPVAYREAGRQGGDRLQRG